jgi:hypothetical protein
MAAQNDQKYTLESNYMYNPLAWTEMGRAGGRGRTAGIGLEEQPLHLHLSNLS